MFHLFPREDVLIMYEICDSIKNTYFRIIKEVESFYKFIIHIVICKSPTVTIIKCTSG